MVTDQQKHLSKWSREVHAARAIEQTTLSDYHKSEARLKLLFDKIESAVVKGSLRPAFVMEYQAHAASHRSLIGNLNEVHKTYVDLVKAAIESLTAVLVRRESAMMSVLEVVNPILEGMVKQCETFRAEFGRDRKTWAEHFQEFIATRGILRSSIADDEFKEFEFTFEEAMLAHPMLPIVASQEVIPVGVARVTADFDPQAEAELAVAEGTRLFLFERWRPGTWMFAMTVDKARWGFVPSAVVEMIEGRTVFAKGPRVGGPAPLRSGELLIVRRDEGRMLLCEAADGAEKLVSPEDVQ
jgi:hypothetical protein